MNRYFLIASILIIAAAVLSFNIDYTTGYAGNVVTSTEGRQGSWILGGGIDISKEGNLFITYKNGILIFDPNGNLLSKFGEVGDKPGQIRSVVDVALDNNGDVYVADRGNNRVNKYDSKGNFILSFGGRGDSPGLFKFLTGISVNDDEVYVVDAKNRFVSIFNKDDGNYINGFEIPHEKNKDSKD